MYLRLFVVYTYSQLYTYIQIAIRRAYCNAYGRVSVLLQVASKTNPEQTLHTLDLLQHISAT